MTNQNNASFYYSVNMLRALLAMKLITEEEYKKIVKLNAEYYDVEIGEKQKMGLPGMCTIAIIAPIVLSKRQKNESRQKRCKKVLDSIELTWYVVQYQNKNAGRNPTKEVK